MNTATIILVLTLATGPGEKDINYKHKVDSIEECLNGAKEFLGGGVPKIEGVLAIRASCLYIPAPEENP